MTATTAVPPLVYRDSLIHLVCLTLHTPLSWTPGDSYRRGRYLLGDLALLRCHTPTESRTVYAAFTRAPDRPRWGHASPEMSPLEWDAWDGIPESTSSHTVGPVPAWLDDLAADPRAVTGPGCGCPYHLRHPAIISGAAAAIPPSVTTAPAVSYLEEAAWQARTAEPTVAVRVVDAPVTAILCLSCALHVRPDRVNNFTRLAATWLSDRHGDAHCHWCRADLKPRT